MDTEFEFVDEMFRNRKYDAERVERFVIKFPKISTSVFVVRYESVAVFLFAPIHFDMPDAKPLQSGAFYLTSTANIGVRDMKSIVGFAASENLTHLVFVHDNITVDALEKCREQNIHVCQFAKNEVLVHFASHVFQPRQVELYTGNDPRIGFAPYPATDPLVKYFGFDVGDKVKMTMCTANTGVDYEYVEIVDPRLFSLVE